MKIPKHLLEKALSDSPKKSAGMSEKEIRESCVQEGADIMFSLVAKWLASTHPALHQVFLDEFK